MNNRVSPEERLWTPANIVTLIRILLVPVFVVALLSPWPDYFPHWDDAELYKPWLAALLFTVLACTDALDGYLARSRGEVTNFGKFMDPLADKILVASALLALIELQILPSWVALIILVREFIVSGLRMFAASKGVVIAASWYGKAKTVFQIIAIVLFIIKQSPWLLELHSNMESVMYIVSWTVMIIALILTVLSMLDYFAKSRSVLGFGTSKKAQEPFTSSQRYEALASENPCLEQDLIEASIAETAQRVITLANNAHVSLGTAESCTGGLICAALTSIPGSSAVVKGGIVSYANEVKEHMLGVLTSDLESHGAVSSEVALEMVEGAAAEISCNVAVSVTGIAGPGGAVLGKPVGTVWFGILGPQGSSSEVMHFDGNRHAVRSQTVLHALSLIERELKKF